MARKFGFGAGQMFSVVLFLVLGLFLFSNFSAQGTCTAEMVNHVDSSGDAAPLHGCKIVGDNFLMFDIPDNVDGTALMLMKISIIGLLVFVSYALVAKWRGTGMSRRDVVALVLIGVAAYFIWPYLVDVLGLSDFDNIAFSVGQKLGFLG